MAAALPTVWEAGDKKSLLSVWLLGEILHSRSLPGNGPGERGFVLSAHPLSNGSLGYGYGAVGIVNLFWVHCIGWSQVSTREGDDGKCHHNCFLGCPFS